MFEDSYKIADFEKHRKNTGFSSVFLCFPKIDHMIKFSKIFKQLWNIVYKTRRHEHNLFRFAENLQILAFGSSLGSILGLLHASWPFLAASWTLLGVSWAPLGRPLGVPWTPLGRPLVTLEPPGCLLGASWAIWDRFWKVSWGFWEDLDGVRILKSLFLHIEHKLFAQSQMQDTKRRIFKPLPFQL